MDKEKVKNEQIEKQPEAMNPVAEQLGCTGLIIVILILVGSCGFCVITATDPNTGTGEPFSPTTKGAFAFLGILLLIVFSIWMYAIWNKMYGNNEEAKAVEQQKEDE